MKKNTKNKTPWVLRFVAWVFPKVEKITPWLAKRWFTSVFFTPARYKMPPPETAIINTAEKHQLKYDNQKIQVYVWGEGKPVLFVHGWMGRAAQFRKFIPLFLDAGYQVISFDAPGHGLSEGKQTHLMHFADIINLLAEKYKPELLIGHSLGGIASIHALLRNRFTEKLITIGSPTIADEIIKAFADKLKASQATVDYFNQYFKKKFGKSFEEFSGRYIIRDLQDVDILVIQDEDDKEVSMHNAEVIITSYKKAKLLKTKGLGHTRILKNDLVIKACLDFVHTGVKQPEHNLME